MKNIGAYLVGLREYEVREAPMPRIENANEVLIKIEYVGICGADQDMFLTGRFGIFDVKYPQIIGHEAAGIVAEVGADVKHLRIGDKVAIEPGVPCGTCEMCIMGRYNLCGNMIFKGAPPIMGCNQTYIVHKAPWCYKLPANISTRDGSLLEPLAVGMHAANQGNVAMGDTVVINGSGTIGLCTLNACRAKGATKIICIDRSPTRLAAAEKMGAIPVNISETDPVERVLHLTDQRGADIVLEASGNAEGFLNTAYMVKPGGRIVCIGLGPEPIIKVDYQTLIYKEASLASVNRYCHDYPLCIDGLTKGLISTDGIITHEFPLAQIQDAYEFAVNNKHIAIKTIIGF